MAAMTTLLEPPAPRPIARAPDIAKDRRVSKKQGLFAPELLRSACIQAFVMLRPDILWKNPVMFVVEVGSGLTTKMASWAAPTKWAPVVSCSRSAASGC